MKVVTPEEMFQIEDLVADQGLTTRVLIENAGRAAAKAIHRYVYSRDLGNRILILLGSGNNSSDGMIAAKYLSQWEYLVTVYFCTANHPEVRDLFPSNELPFNVISLDQDNSGKTLGHQLTITDVVIDAVLGTGLNRPISEPISTMFHQVNIARATLNRPRVLALDVPSGVDSGTGNTDPATVPMDATITLGNPKIGLFLGPASSVVGEVIPVSIGLPEDLPIGINKEMLTPEWARTHLPSRSNISYKGSFGRVLALAGSRNYVGAPVLACLGALRSGSGGVTLATIPSVQSLVATQLTEATYLLLAEVGIGEFAPSAASELRKTMDGYDAFLLGCGLGQGASIKTLIHHTILSDPPLKIPLIIDADALNILSDIPNWWDQINGVAVLTPHTGEMAKLLKKDVATITSNRIETAIEAAMLWNQTVVLKGPFTAVAAPDGSVRIVPFATPALATPGTGDILAGMVAGFLGQGLSPFDAASLAAFVHGWAGITLTKQQGPAGTIASDVLPTIPFILNSIHTGSSIEIDL